MSQDSGYKSAGQYLVSGTPWLSGGYIVAGSETYIYFPFVSKSFTVKNTGSVDMRIHFANSGAYTIPGDTVALPANPLVIENNRYFTIDAGATLTYDVKTKEVWLTSPSGTGFELAAELTSIDSFPRLSGSGINT